jgi:hypothetical protein
MDALSRCSHADGVAHGPGPRGESHGQEEVAARREGDEEAAPTGQEAATPAGKRGDRRQRSRFRRIGCVVDLGRIESGVVIDVGSAGTMFDPVIWQTPSPYLTWTTSRHASRCGSTSATTPTVPERRGSSTYSSGGFESTDGLREERGTSSNGPQRGRASSRSWRQSARPSSDGPSCRVRSNRTR